MTIPAACHHVFADQHRCGSPALRGERFCYFHHPERKPVSNLYERRSRRGFRIAQPQDRQSLQRAISDVCQRLAANTLDVRRAGLILHSLQMLANRLP